MVNPAVTPAFRRRLFALFLASCTFSIFAYAQPTPVITGESAVCQGDSYFYATDYTLGHSWSWTVTAGGTILQNLGNFIEVRWNGPQNSTQSVSVTETDGGGLTGSDIRLVSIIRSLLTCENALQVSLEQDGDSEILPDMLLEGNYNTYAGFSVNIFTLDGFPIGNILTCADVGKTFTGKVTDGCTGNSCWTTLIVEDKLPPVFVCPVVPIEIPCDADISTFAAPLVFDNCDAAIEVNLIGYQVDNSDVCDGVWITRNWSAVDNYNQHAYCSETLHISPNGPIDFPDPQNWTCTQYDQYPNITDPTELTDSLHTTGSGRPYGVGGPYCQYNYLHSDDTLYVCGNSFKIIRTWVVVNWCTGEVIVEDFEGDSNEQLITVMDYNAPTITVPTIVLNANQPGAYPVPCRSTDLLPPPVVFDSCNDMTVQIFTAVGEAVYVNGVDGKQGGYVPLPGLKIGLQIITYKVTDACGNSTQIDVVATVTDLTAPVNICVEYVDVNLESDGFTEVFAESFDLASHDNCCLDRMEVKRMGDPDGSFAPSIEFTCADVPAAMVVLRVYDCFDNYNDCMVTAHVNDKIAPICIAPQSKTMPCTDLPPDVTQSWLNGFGSATFYDNCEATITELPFAENINNCGEGHIIRSWAVVDSAGNVSGTCVQNIFVTPDSDWLIKFPKDFFGSCDEIVDADSIEINNFGCDMLAVAYTDQFFALTFGDSACYKIVRTWKVINWCNHDPYAQPILVNHDSAGVWVDEEDFNNFGNYHYQQIIKIYDDTPPVLSYPFAAVFCSQDATCTAGDVYLPIQIEGVCSDNFNVVYHLDLSNNFTYDLHGTGFFEGQLPIGKHRIVYVVEDGCNNVSELTVLFEVKDCKKPTALCENGLIVEIMQTGMVPICASALNYGSYDNCPGELHFSFSPDVSDSCRIFVCEDLGTIPINLWVTDAAGNQDYCATFIVVQDNMFHCLTGEPVNGLVAMSNAEPVENVTVTLNSNNGDQVFTTATDGVYAFSGLGVGGDYTVTPLRDDSPRNGVTTFDLVLMSKHILDITPFTSPYQYIAADANKSNNISTFDLVEVRKLILLVNDQYPNNTSWRFVDKAYQFPNPANPWAEVFPEVINTNNLPGGLSGLDFVAIKIGDVNNSADAHSFTNGDTGERSNGTLNFEMENEAFEANEAVTVILKAKDFNTVSGFQFTLEFNPDLLDFQQTSQTSITGPANFGLALIDQGAVTVSWNNDPPLTLADGTEIIKLEFEGKTVGNLADAIFITSKFTEAEAYIGELGDLYDVGLVVTNTASATNAGAIAGYELYQNVPNPFSKKTAIGFRMPSASDATLTVYDAFGKKITTVSKLFQAGYNEIELDRNTLPTDGLVYYRLESGSFTATRSMTIVR